LSLHLHCRQNENASFLPLYKELNLSTMDIARILNTPTIQRQYPSEIEDTLEPPSPSEASTQSWDSANGPRPSSLSPNPRARVQTSRNAWLIIKTALLFKVPWKTIREKLGVTNNQIALAQKEQLTP
jgi:hypothetical protein